MKHLYLLLFLLFTLSVNSQTLNGPESIAYDAVNNRYLISNTGSGTILARSASGVLSVFKSGISPAPYGIEIVGNYVYACCSGFIKSFDLSTGTQLLNINTGATFLNGITSDGYTNLFASDFTGKKIYRINTSTSSFNVMAQNLVQSPNGMVYDQAHNRIVFVNWGANAPIKALSLSDSTVTTIATTTLGNCDGLAWNGLDTWYVSCWTGQKIVKFDRDFLNAPVTIATGMSSPADIYYNTYSDTLAIPNSGNNTVSFIGFPAITNVNCNLLPFLSAADASVFEATTSSFGDSVLYFNLTNHSGLGFAYPLARITPISALPAGMTFGQNSQGFQVFASAWNPDSVVQAAFYFNVTQAIPENTYLDFQVDITNLFPSSADTCFFTDTFHVNLNPGIVLGTENVAQTWNVYPNPSNEKVLIQLPTDNGSLSIYDNAGRHIQYIQIHSKQVTLDREILPHSGMYHLVWSNGSGTKTSQKTLIIKE
jgi:hypothetical protein